jgi:TFIIF-interacting CTD phosphatase-like protein
MIKTRSNGIAVKFFITVRRGMIQALLKLRQKFDTVIYSSLDQEMADAIIDYLEQNLAGGKRLFD